MSQEEAEMPMTLTRSFFAVILPGVVVIAPWILYGLQELPGLAVLYKTYAVPVQICAFSLVVVVGGLIESLGTYVEKRWDVRAGATAEPDGDENWLEKDWFDYLSYKFGDAEPVAYHYLSRKVTELYFELGLMISGPIGLSGAIFILKSHLSDVALCVLWLFVLAACLILWKFAKDTHAVLYDSRHRIMRRLNATQ